MTRPRIAVIALGGTIASVPGAGGRDAVPSLSAEQLLASVPAAVEVADVECTTFRQFPSGDLTVADVIALADEIDRRFEHVDGVVVTQGTDTLEETSYLLDLVSAFDKPVVMTGAMRNSGLPGADGPANVLAALRVSASPLARGVGPLVVFADEIHLPRYVRKTHSSSVAAFESPNAGPIGWVTEDRVRLGLVPRLRTEPFDRSALLERTPVVAIATLGLGAEAESIDRFGGDGVAGLVVQVFGGGHVPRDLVAPLAALAERIPVVIASRTGAGELYESTYAFPGSEKDLLGRGILSAGALDGLKARLLLTLLIAEGADHTAIRDRFSRASD